MLCPTRLVAGTSGTAITTAARALRPPAEPRPDSSAPPTNWSGPGSSRSSTSSGTWPTCPAARWRNSRYRCEPVASKVFEYPKDKTALGLQGGHGARFWSRARGAALPCRRPHQRLSRLRLRAPGDPRRITARGLRSAPGTAPPLRTEEQAARRADGFERQTCPAEGAWATIKCGYKPRAAEDEKPGRPSLIPVRLLMTPQTEGFRQQASVTFPPRWTASTASTMPTGHLSGSGSTPAAGRPSSRSTAPTSAATSHRSRTPTGVPAEAGCRPFWRELTLIIATNVRKIIAWAWDEIDTAHGFERPRRQRRRRTDCRPRPVPNAPPGAEAALRPRRQARSPQRSRRALMRPLRRLRAAPKRQIRGQIRVLGSRSALLRATGCTATPSAPAEASVAAQCGVPYKQKRRSHPNGPTYRRRDSNPHAFRHRNLNPACLPVPPLRRYPQRERNSV